MNEGSGGEREGLDAAEALRLILRHTPDPILIKTADNRFVEVNDALLRHFGLSRGRVIGRAESEIEGLDPEEMDRYVSDTERVARGSEPEVVIEPATSPATGERKVFRSVKAPARDKEGRSLVVIVAQDISDLELARERLADREAVLQATLQAVASGTWEFEPLTGSLRNDQAWMEIFGVKPEDHDGTVGTFARLLHPEDQASVMARVNACLHDGVQGYVSEHRMLHADGHVIWVRDSGVVVNRDPDGNALRMVGAVVDITELKTQQAELERRRREAEAAVHAKSRFLANMSHELRTPMNGVLGMLDHLLDTELGAEQRDLARIARTSAEGLLAILNDILDTSKLEAGGVELEAVCVDLDGLLDEVEGMFGNQAREKGLGLRLQRGSSTPRCAMGDPTRLRQVLVNLLGNALKFTSEGFVDLDLEGREGRLEVHVRDTGPGISEEAQARLFERFTQADVSTTRKFGGSGLGLAITRQLVELMGGEIEVNSAVGEGSCFTLRLPLVAASEESLDTAAVPPASVDLPPLRVLLADDVPVNRMVVGRLLERLGHEVVSVENGRQAVEAVTGEAFDLVLMDINMPEMDGVEATAAIRALEGASSRTPIVALTANAMKGDRETYLDAGMDDYVAKPVRRPQLKEAMARALQGRTVRR